ncbi:hypothetical protein EV652_12646 [Kribbella steppae]|uniref:Lipoprotein LprG n=1 Tax=Kribbella steppae TaxID=2512223 RepID=A0A4R2GW62_9ACTN|nr:hypothetical protein [Kribbella steppae]TCO13505.1 hypothetical protein EV652_12646 [Kribbella steppae]
MRLSTRVAAAAAILPLLLGTAACGGEKPVSTAIKPAPVTTTAAPQQAAPVVYLNRKTFVPAMTAAQAKLKSWRLLGRMMINGSPVLTMSGLQTTRPAAMALVMKGSAIDGKTARVVMIKNTVYLSVPGVSPAGKFVKLAAGQTSELRDLVDTNDPTKNFEALGPALRGVTHTGSQQFSGEKLQVYEVTVDVAKLLKAQGKKVPAGAPRTATYVLWMDSAHRVRELTFEFAQVSVSMSLSDFDKPVSIKAPPASKIVRR